ncbi:MAG: hypothetical protein H7Y43_09270 [Akkermansiaceae bacterium]|nr:hypothetical protein [Verrucomicrobiales bacterium]
MKLRYAKNDDIVTVRFGQKCYAVAEARDLKAAGYASRSAVKGHLGEWTLRAKSWRDFQRLLKKFRRFQRAKFKPGQFEESLGVGQPLN